MSGSRWTLRAGLLRSVTIARRLKLSNDSQITDYALLVDGGRWLRPLIVQLSRTDYRRIGRIAARCCP